MSDGEKLYHLKWTILFCLLSLFWQFKLTKCSDDKLLVVSMDGFRYDYYDYYAKLMPNLVFLANNGVHAKNGVKSTFATMTFPTHFTIATGLNEESHGLVANSFWDREHNRSYIRNAPEKYFYQGEPIWVTAKKAHKKTAVIIWVGNGADWSPYNPDTNKVYDPTFPLENRLDTALALLSNGTDLAMVYLDQPDAIQHESGTFSANLRNTMIYLDKLIQKIVSIATQGPLASKLNVILLADHGLVNVTDRKQIDMNLVANRTLEAVKLSNGSFSREKMVSMLKGFRYEVSGTITHFYATSNLFHPISQANLFRKSMTENNVSRILEEMKKMKFTKPRFEEPIKIANLTYYLRPQLPDRWFYKNNDRIGDLVIVADAGTVHNVIGINSTSALPPGNANHGYDNELKEMRPIFIAYGPRFKRNYTLTNAFPQNCIYSLMCEIMKVRPAPNNGTLEPFRDALKTNAGHALVTYSSITWITLLSLFVNF